MKVDLSDVKVQLRNEMKELEKKIANLECEIKDVEAVERIAERLSGEDPVDKAIEELKKGNDKEDQKDENNRDPAKKDETLDWAFQS
jgi:hypothetical protein